MRAHLIAGGFPPGSSAAHDIDYARLGILKLLNEHGLQTTVTNDFTDVDNWLSDCKLLITYVAGPFPDSEQNAFINTWLDNGGHWVALHGTSGGKAARVKGKGRKMVKLAHHHTLGAFFLNHPPIRRFRVDVQESNHPLMKNIPSSFEVVDELYLIEMLDEHAKVLLTTELPEDPSPPGFGFAYDADTSLLEDGKTRVLGYVREVGAGAVVYWALGHCHSPATNSQPFVDTSVAEGGTTPTTFRGVWETSEFQQLLGNSITWALNS
jgi:type 1 glutamine amidotransferase